MKLGAIICLALVIAVAHPVPTDVDDPGTLTYLRGVHEALGTASRAISACANDGCDRRECICEHQDLVLEFHAAVKVLLTEHPKLLNTER